jgi:hypothetical protein
MFFLAMCFLGITVLLFSRTLNTVEEDKWKDGVWFREIIYGPPGLRRAMAAMSGIILIIVGVIGSVWAAFLS